jgi:hypothetical protein
MFVSASASATPVLIDFDDATGSFVPPAFYASRGVSLRMALSSPWGPTGNGEISLSTAASAGLPSPAAGNVLIPYANLAGYLGSMEFTFSTPIDSFGLYAFGPQALSLSGFRNNVLVGTVAIPAQTGRVSVLASLGSVGGGQLFDFVRVSPTVGFPFPFDPNTGPGYYDLLSYNTVPGPTVAVPVALCAASFRGRRR